MPDPTKFDDVGWHVDGALEAGQPEENAATHIGLYLGWLIRRDMHSPDFFLDDWVDAIREGEMSGSEALSSVDDKLTSDLMTDEARAFTDWYYSSYLSDYAERFDDNPDYSIADDQVARNRIEPLLDERYDKWVADGRPRPDPSRATELELSDIEIPVVEVMFPARDLWDSFDPEARAMLEAEVAEAKDRGITVTFGRGPEEMPHEAPELEALIPTDLASRFEIHSVTAKRWRSAQLSRVLKRRETRPVDAKVVIGMGGRGEETVTATLYGLPGATAVDLATDVPTLTKQPGMVCEERVVAGRNVLWCSRPEFLLAGWARDGMVVVASAQEEARLERLVSRLP